MTTLVYWTVVWTILIAALALTLLLDWRRRRNERINDAMRRLSAPTWTTKDGRTLLISAMDNTHLINTLRFIDRKYASLSVARREQYPYLYAEALRRGLNYEALR